MYVLIVPASVPFVLLATVMGLSWWEDHILPTAPAEPVDRPAQAPIAPAAPAHPAELPRADTALTREVVGR
ncbi:hypothetical protein [Streptomyces phaeochromogenes]|uniref:hypothetical protein n=1 Tax=Streptomyces phaeochromogenes TaxID=1923 RepID=UPI00367C3097